MWFCVVPKTALQVHSIPKLCFNLSSSQDTGPLLVLVTSGIYTSVPSDDSFCLRMLCGTLAGGGKRLFTSELNVDR